MWCYVDMCVKLCCAVLYYVAIVCIYRVVLFGFVLSESFSKSLIMYGIVPSMMTDWICYAHPTEKQYHLVATDYLCGALRQFDGQFLCLIVADNLLLTNSFYLVIIEALFLCYITWSTLPHFSIKVLIPLISSEFFFKWNPPILYFYFSSIFSTFFLFSNLIFILRQCFDGVNLRHQLAVENSVSFAR